MRKGKSFPEALNEVLKNPSVKGAWDRVIED